jgi:phage anti-repressor protein
MKVIYESKDTDSNYQIPNIYNLYFITVFNMNTNLQALPSFITSVTTDLTTPCIDARELHEFLGSKQHFNDWIKNRITKFDFIENQDFQLHIFMMPENLGMQVRHDYIVSPHMAKELGMLENNERGKAIRKYFIQCEEQLKIAQQQLIYLLQKENDMKQNLLNQPERVYLKRNTVSDLSNVLGIPEFKLNTVLYDNGYCDKTGFPLPRAKGEFDCVDNEIRWSLPLIMRLLK